MRARKDAFQLSPAQRGKITALDTEGWRMSVLGDVADEAGAIRLHGYHHKTHVNADIIVGLNGNERIIERKVAA